MVGSTRPFLVLGLLLISIGAARLAPAQDDPPRDEAEAGPQLNDPAAPFVPLNPRTVEDRRRIEAMQAFSAARALEAQRQLPEAVTELERALSLDPESVAVLRRLSLLCFALGRTEQAVTYSRRALEADPDDAATVARLVRYYERNDPDGAEAMLTGLRANPKLKAESPTALLIDFALGRLYGDRLRRLDRANPDHAATQAKAADAFVRVLDGLDKQDAADLPADDQPQIFGQSREAEVFRAFGTVLSEAGRHDQAIRAFRRGLVGTPGDPELRLGLARALLEAGQAEEALSTTEQLLKQTPRRPETYELLGRCLEAVGRADEVLPRLEAAAAADPKDRSARYALADRYAKAGRAEQARALYEQLRATPPNAQDFGPLSAWLLREARYADLLKLLGEATTRREGFEAIRPQLEAITADPALADRLLDTAIGLMSADPPGLSKESRRVLALIANIGKGPKSDKLVQLLRLAVQKDPNTQDYGDLIDTLSALNRHEEASAALEELLIKYPDARNARTLTALGRSRFRAGQKDAAIEALNQARKLEPNNPEVLFSLAIALGNSGRDDEAIAAVRDVLKLDQANLDFNRLLGSLLVQSGKDDEAIAHYRALLDRFPGNVELVKVARSGLSALYVNRGDYAQGEAELEILFKMDPDDAGVNNDLGYLYADQGKKLEQAEEMVRKALEEEPENGAYLDSLGWVLFKRGKLQEAAVELEKASATQADSDGTINDHLGDVYFRLGDFAKAREAWERAAKLADESRMGDKRLPEIRKKIDALQELKAAPRPATGDTP